MSDKNEEVRPLEVRLVEYRDSLLGLVKQFGDLALTVEQGGGWAGPIRDAERLYELIADDISKIIEGEELKQFRVEVEL